MTFRVSNDPYGFKKLLVYRKAEEMQHVCAAYTATFRKEKTLIALADQMDRSARSVKQNIVEGWKRNSTKEYHQFLGFSMGANAELEEDCDDILRGIYPRLIKGEMGERGIMLDEVEKMQFYPLNSHLPPLVQLKLRCRELNFLLTKLQQSLNIKMREPDMTIKGAWGTGESGKSGDEWLTNELEKQDLVRLPDGRIVPKDTRSP